MAWDYEPIACLGGPEDGRVVSIAKSINEVKFPYYLESDEIGDLAGGAEPQKRLLRFSVYRKSTLPSGETVLVHAP